jgi:hypothetical protein
MTAAPRKEKEKKQTPEERLQALRYNHMMYGPTAGERRPAGRRADYGAPYLKHPKFQSLMTAFKKGTAFTFEVTDKGRTFPIATDGTQITFDGKVVFYSRHLNRYEENLLLDRSIALQCQSIEAFVHLVFAVIRSLPGLEVPALSHFQGQFYLEGETLEVGIEAAGPNLMVGAYRHAKVQARPTR